MYFYYYNKFRPLTFHLLYGLWQAHTISNSITLMAAKRVLGPQGKRKLGSPPPILQIMILKLSPPRCVISKESVQQKSIDELWFRKQLSTCLFVMGPRSLHRLTPPPHSGPDYTNICVFYLLMPACVIHYRNYYWYLPNCHYYYPNLYFRRKAHICSYLLLVNNHQLSTQSKKKWRKYRVNKCFPINRKYNLYLFHILLSN